MFFAGEDALAIHTISHAAFRILLDLSRQSGSIVLAQLEELIRPGAHKEFWAATSRVANYLKHADRDADQDLTTFNEPLNEFLLLLACLLYESLDHSGYAELKTHMVWMMGCYPDLVVDRPSDVRSMIQKLADNGFDRLGRAEKIWYGDQLIRITREAGVPSTR